MQLKKQNESLDFWNRFSLRGHSKSTSLRKGGVSPKKSDKNGANKVMPLTQNFSIPIFFSTQFPILCIIFGSDNIAVSSNKNI